MSGDLDELVLSLLGMKARCLEPETMDDPSLDGARHDRALRGLARINLFSGSVRILSPPIRDLARRIGAPSLRVLDVATGAGDVPIRLWRRARMNGLRLEIDACDISGRALEYGRQQAARKAVPIRFFALDAANEPIAETYDVIISSQFLHHLNDEQAVALLRNMQRSARHLVLINDLRRCAFGLVVAYFGSRTLTTSRIMHVDGPRSVRASFTISEIAALAARAGLDGATVGKHWPWRFLLQWRRA